MLAWINKKRNKKGFTLIELIVVIAILGILAALAVPRLTGAQDSAREKTHNANIKTLRSAANIAIAENGAPDSKATTDTLHVTWKGSGDDGKGNVPTTDPSSDTVFTASKYLDKWPVSPYKSGDAYTLTISKHGVIEIKYGGAAVTDY